MPTPTFSQTSFASGEVSPRLFGRSDLRRYANGAETIRNLMCLTGGGLIRRPGTRYVAAAKDTTNNVRLIPFEFSTSETYVLEFGPLYVRFFRNDTTTGLPGQLEFSGSPSEIVTTYTSADIPDIKFIQSADVLYLFHPDHIPRTLSRTATPDNDPSNWTLASLLFEDGPYRDLEGTGSITTISGNTGDTVRTFTFDTAQDILAEGSSAVGTVIRTRGPAAQSKFATWRVSGVTSSTICELTATDLEGWDDTIPQAEFIWGIWNPVDGWPETATFHANRFWAAANSENPQRLWASTVGNFTLFRDLERDGTGGDDPDIGLSFNIDDNQVNRIRWLVSDAKGLLVATSGGLYIGTGGSFGDAITPDNILIVKQSNRPADDRARPQKVGDTTLVVTEGGLKVREFSFDFDTDRFVSPDLTIIAEHITQDGTSNGLIDTAFQKEPNSVFWGLRADGVMVALTLEKAEEVIAWHRHVLGGTRTGASQPEVKSIAAIRNLVLSYDQVWVLVDRTIDGTNVRYIEAVNPEFGINEDHETAFFVDCGLTYDGASTDSISGLDHLNGETVKILADGADHPDVIVSSGAVALNYSVTKASVGLAQTYTMKTLPILPTGAGIDPRGKLIRAFKSFISVFRSLGGKVGSETGDVSPIQYREFSGAMDTPPPLRTEIVEKSMPNSSDRRTALIITGDDAQPMSILSVSHETVLDGP